MNDLHDKYVSEERQWAQQSIKAAEGRGMTCFLWRCHLCWSLLTQLREWWIYDRYECSSSLIISFMEIMKNILSCLWWWSNFFVFQTLVFLFIFCFLFSLNAISWIPFMTIRGWSCCMCYLDVFHLDLVYFFWLWYLFKLPTLESYRVFVVIIEIISIWWQWNLHAVLHTFFKRFKPFSN